MTTHLQNRDSHGAGQCRSYQPGRPAHGLVANRTGVNALFALLGLLLYLVLFPSAAHAQEGDKARAARQQANIGEQFELTVELVAPPGVTVELDPANPSWQGVEIVRIVSQDAIPEGEGVRHIIIAVVAGFFPGDLVVEPAVVLTANGIGTPRILPAFPLLVSSTLAADAPLELLPLPGAASIDGGESPLLRPAIYGGGVLGVALLSALLYLLVQRARRRAVPVLVGGPAQPVADFGTAERLIDADPVGAYRALAAVVRRVVAERYNVPAASLTSREIAGRMESQGVDRWQARLVSGLLQECEAVVYAGYVPAAERRHADLTMAREIVEGASA